MPQTAAIIVAAGSGRRAGGPLPKQWQSLGGMTVIERTITALRPHVTHSIVVLRAKDAGLYADLTIKADQTCIGGATRSASVLAGLTALADIDPDFVLIHDAARPLVSPQTIRSIRDALETNVAAAPALAVSDTLWRGEDSRVIGTQDRTALYRAQTPQGFHYAPIRAAYGQANEATDDVTIARQAGLDVAILPGDERNMKITTKEDFARASKLLGSDMDVRSGNGYDVHRFGPGTSVWLCGVEIAHDRALQGHSDADVGMHAITDAIYGALGQGDIGQHFPPSDPQWKGAASHIFLQHAVDLATQHGYRIGNIDCTLVCEFPKIGPHQPAMKAALSDITGIAVDRISVKATTSEKLGFTGRGEGIASIATATLIAS